MNRPIYLDHQATTPVDPRVLAAMLPYFSENFGNAASVTHDAGRHAKDAVEQARAAIAGAIGASDKEITFTSGATESNNLAIFGVARRSRRGRHIVSVVTEHRAVLDPLLHLQREGFEVTLLPVASHDSSSVGRIELDQFRDSLRDSTCLVSIMWANNEIGVLQPLTEIGQLCRERGIPLHCDGTQAVGKLPLNVAETPLDLLSFTGHKMYGPKGCGVLYVRRRPATVRLEPQIFGGGHEMGLRSGTLNVPGIIGLAEALKISIARQGSDADHLAQLRWQFWSRLTADVDDLWVNGPPIAGPAPCDSERLPGNLNFRMGGVDGQAVLTQVPELALSSGAACTSFHPEPSHVLQAIGLSVDEARASLRVSPGRFTTLDDINLAADQLARAITQLRRLGGGP